VSTHKLSVVSLNISLLSSRPGISRIACSHITTFSPSSLSPQHMEKLPDKARVHIYICSAVSVTQLSV